MGRLIEITSRTQRPGPFPEGRVCEGESCITRLSRTNPGPLCRACDRRVDAEADYRDSLAVLMSQPPERAA